MVGEGLGSTLLPELAVLGGLLSDHRVAAVRLADGVNRRTIGLVWRRQSPRAAGFRAVADLIRRWVAGRKGNDSRGLRAIGARDAEAPHRIT
jgi:LysR family hydrogen peroxide-inducible transcriptional activator